MAIILSHISALEYLSSDQVNLDDWAINKVRDGWWLEASPFEADPDDLYRWPDEDPKSRKAAVGLVSEMGLSTPVHTLVQDPANRYYDKRFCCHESSIPADVKPFLKISNRLFACLPELCFIQMAQVLSLQGLIALGYEICGFYSLRQSGSGICRRRRPLTTAARLRSFADGASGVYGAKKARRAARCVIDGAASPAETSLAMMMTLPYSLGGYGLPAPRLNHRVGCLGQMSGIYASAKDHMICDAVWPHVVVEYDSEQEHGTYKAMEKDALRRNNLSLSTAILQATKNMLTDPKSTDHLADLIARHEGHRINPRRVDYESRKQSLRKELNEAHGNTWLHLV